MSVDIFNFSMVRLFLLSLLASSCLQNFSSKSIRSCGRQPLVWRSHVKHLPIHGVPFVHLSSQQLLLGIFLRRIVVDRVGTVLQILLSGHGNFVSRSALGSHHSLFGCRTHAFLSFVSLLFLFGMRVCGQVSTGANRVGGGSVGEEGVA